MTNLMKVGELEINRSDLTISSVRSASIDTAVVHSWLTMWQSNHYGLTKEQALIGMVIALSHQLKEANRMLLECNNGC